MSTPKRIVHTTSEKFQRTQRPQREQKENCAYAGASSGRRCRANPDSCCPAERRRRQNTHTMKNQQQKENGRRSKRREPWEDCAAQTRTSSNPGEQRTDRATSQESNGHESKLARTRLLFCSLISPRCSCSLMPSSLANASASNSCLRRQQQHSNTQRRQSGLITTRQTRGLDANRDVHAAFGHAVTRAHSAAGSSEQRVEGRKEERTKWKHRAGEAGIEEGTSSEAKRLTCG